MHWQSRRSVLKAGGVLTTAALIPDRAEAETPVQAAQAQGPAGKGDPWARCPGILARIDPPTFPRRRFLVTDYGAVGDGVTDCTAAFRAAIKACNAAGGGHVVVPRGRFSTGAIHLLSHVDLHVSEGGVIAFSINPNAYLPVVLTRWEGTECYNYSPFIYAYGQRDVAVTGKGTLDGQAADGPWETWYRTSGWQSADQTLLRQMGTDGVPVRERVFGAGHYLRPNMIQFYRCRNVLVDQVTVLEPAMWTIHPVLCTNVTVRDVTVVSTLYNTDGCDPESCSYVQIVGCRFNTNDDCIAIKSGRDEDGMRIGVPSEKIVVRNCLFSGRWGGLAVGSEMSGGVRDIFVENCDNNSPDLPGNYPVKYPLYIKANKRRGGYIDGVYLRGISGRDIERDPVHITAYYNSGQDGTRPVSIGNIHVDRMRIDGFGDHPLYLEGLETDHITGVHLSKCDFTGSSTPAMIQYTDDLTYRKVFVNGLELR